MNNKEKNNFFEWREYCGEKPYNNEELEDSQELFHLYRNIFVTNAVNLVIYKLLIKEILSIIIQTVAGK